MKKLGLLVIPLMVVSFLAGCGNNNPDQPTDEHMVTEQEFNDAVSFNDTQYLQIHSVATTRIGSASSDIEISPTVYHASRSLTETLQPSYEECFVAKKEDGTYDRYFRTNRTGNFVLSKNVDSTEFITVKSEDVNILKQLQIFDLAYKSFTYSKSDSAYVVSFTPESFPGEIDETLEFENKKVVGAKQKIENGTQIEDVSTYKYEEKTPTLPDVPPEYSISSTNDQVTISSNVLTFGTPYEGKITVKKGVAQVLPDDLNDIKLETSGASIKNSCTYTRTSSREATLEIPSDVISDGIVVYITLKDPVSAHNISIATANVTIDPNIYENGIKYMGTITTTGEKLLPNALSSVKLNTTGESIINGCTYQVHSDKKTATFTIDSEYTIHNSDISIALDLIDAPKWYEQTDWWNYCSNGISGSQASSEDIGKEVEVEVNTLKHKVRLIDCDKDILSSDGTTKAHCTFEFANVITESNGDSLNNFWDINFYDPFHTNNYNYSKSYISKQILNAENRANSVINLLPEGLRDAIKYVDKKVGTGSSYSTETPFSIKLFLLSHDEMTSHVDNVADGEGTMYKYYENGGVDFNKKTVNGSKNECYWTRSPATKQLRDAWFWSQDGFNCGVIMLNHFAVAPAFCI